MSATPTWYEVLGVAPDADHDAVKRAYLRQALACHPDRDPGRSVSGDSLARMQQVNEAWRVLRSPAGRAAYDRTLAATGPDPDASVRPASAPAQPGPAPASGHGNHGRAGGSHGTGVHDARSPEVPSGSAGRSAVVFLLVGLAVIAGVVLVGLAAPGPTPSRVDLDVVERLAPGTCIDTGGQDPGSAEGLLLRAVDCTEPHDLRVVDRRPFPQPCPTGSVAVVLSDEGYSICTVPA